MEWSTRPTRTRSPVTARWPPSTDGDRFASVGFQSVWASCPDRLKSVLQPRGTMGDMRTIALLLIAHGSRHAGANDDLHHVAAALRERGHTLVESSFLELAEPTIEQGGVHCVEQGAECVVLVPYFLSAGVHVCRDLSEARRRLA